MLSNGGNGAADGATAQATANTNEDATDTQRERELVARNRALEHALRQLVQATFALRAGLRTKENVAGLAERLAKAHLNVEVDSDDEAGAASAASAGGDSDDDGEFVHCIQDGVRLDKKQKR